jgi:hypothetical protein
MRGEKNIFRIGNFKHQQLAVLELTLFNTEYLFGSLAK